MFIKKFQFSYVTTHKIYNNKVDNWKVRHFLMTQQRRLRYTAGKFSTCFFDFFPLSFFLYIFYESVTLNKLKLRIKEIHSNLSKWIRFRGTLTKIQQYPFFFILYRGYRPKIFCRILLMEVKKKSYLNFSKNHVSHPTPHKKRNPS